MSDRWIQEVKRTQKEYKAKGINLTYQQAMLLAKDSYQQIKANPTQPPPPIKIEPEKIPPFKSRAKVSPSLPNPHRPQVAPHPYDYGYEYSPDPRPPPPTRGRAKGDYQPTGRPVGRPRGLPPREEYEEDYYPPPRRNVHPQEYYPPPRYRREEGYEYED